MNKMKTKLDKEVSLHQETKSQVTGLTSEIAELRAAVSGRMVMSVALNG